MIMEATTDAAWYCRSLDRCQYYRGYIMLHRDMLIFSLKACRLKRKEGGHDIG